MKEDLSPAGYRIKTATKKWIKEKAKKQERSENWMANKILDEAKAKDEVASHE